MPRPATVGSHTENGIKILTKCEWNGNMKWNGNVSEMKMCLPDLVMGTINTFLSLEWDYIYTYLCFP